MTHVTGALAIIRERVQNQQIVEIERRVARQHAEECVRRALAKYHVLVDARDTAARSWPLTDREVKIWEKKVNAADEILTAAVERWVNTP